MNEVLARNFISRYGKHMRNSDLFQKHLVFKLPRPQKCNFICLVSKRKLSYLLFILTSVWVLRTPNAGRNNHFQHFFCKKARNLQQISAKNMFFGNKTADQRFGANLKNLFITKNFLLFSDFLHKKC